jgi:hypothetical protein
MLSKRMEFKAELAISLCHTGAFDIIDRGMYSAIHAPAVKEYGGLNGPDPKVLPAASFKVMVISLRSTAA